MLISGKKLSKKIINRIRKNLLFLSQKNIIPKIAIVTMGPDTTWKAYVRQKVKLAENLGIQAKVFNLTASNQKDLLDLVQKLNTDQSIHGMIVQRPLPKNIDIEKVINAIDPKKDTDGFRKDSDFKAPIWLAVQNILKETFRVSKKSDLILATNFLDWLKSKNIVVIGKGETGGMPIIKSFEKIGIKPMIIDSKTNNKEELTKNADIIISAVGKERVIESKDLKKGVILIGIGIFRGKDEKLHGDYNEEEIKNTASFHTPTPGGVGPLNLSYLFKNLINAAGKRA